MMDGLRMIMRKGARDGCTVVCKKCTGAAYIYLERLWTFRGGLQNY
jgi:hypothetical protein